MKSESANGESLSVFHGTCSNGCCWIRTIIGTKEHTARAVDQTSQAIRSGTGHRIICVATLCTHAGHQEPCSRHLSPHGLRIRTCTRTNNRTHSGHAAGTNRVLASGTQRTGHHRRRRSLAVMLQHRAARVGGSNQHKDPAAMSPADIQKWIERIDAHPRIERDRVQTQWALRVKNGPGIGRTGAGDIAPLGITNGDEPRILGHATGLSQRGPARSTQRLVEGKLRLDRRHKVSDRIDDHSVEVNYRLSSTLKPGLPLRALKATP